MTLGSDPVGNIRRLDNALEKISEKLKQAEQKLETLNAQVKVTKEQLGRPFPQEALLAEKSARLVEFDSLLSLDAKNEPEAQKTETKKSDVEKSADEVSTLSQCEPTFQPAAKTVESKSGEIKPFIYVSKPKKLSKENPAKQTPEARASTTKKKGDGAR